MPPTCNHPAVAGGCSRTVPDEDTYCFMHDATGTPSSHGAPTGNDNAVGNSGGGAPPMNTNAWIHGAFCDTELLGDRLREDALEETEKLANSIAERAEQTAPELDEEERERLAWRYAVLNHQWHLSTIDTLDRGFGFKREKEFEMEDESTETFEVDVVNPTATQGLRLSARMRRIWNKLNLSVDY